MLLEEMTTVAVKEYLAKDQLVIIPVGATEQHGPANPVGTDFLIAQNIAREACKRAKVVCAPTIPIGVSEHHKSFAGSLWVRPRVYVELIKEYIQSLVFHGFTKIIILNGHGGNTASLREVANELYYNQNIRVAAIDWWNLPNSDLMEKAFPGYSFGHGEEIETSINLAIHPHLVNEDNISKIQTPPMKWGKFLKNVAVPAYTDEFAPDGVVGSLKNISPESGKTVLEAVIKNLIDFIQEFRSY